MKRFQHAFRHELVLHWRTMSVTTLAVAGAVMLLQMVRWWRGPLAFNLWNGFGLVTMVIGIIITTGMFGELRSPGSRLELLLRPASVLEKVGAKLLVSTVLFMTLITGAFLLASLVSLLLYLLLGGRADLLLFFDNGQWLVTAGAAFFDYLPVQAVFFFGSVYFRKNPAGRTLLAMVGWVASYLVLSLAMTRLIFAPYVTGRYAGLGAPRALGFQLDRNSGFIAGSRIWAHVAPGFLLSGRGLGITVRVLVLLTFWGLSFLRFRETEG
ncbi:MAG: hypothetical protein EA427_13470 [Spirochaetaceae bacterium]|nr:MAG: hypothetical protein EA427_13470 [Spirochaetaceae bacterium]